MLPSYLDKAQNAHTARTNGQHEQIIINLQMHPNDLIWFYTLNCHSICIFVNRPAQVEKMLVCKTIGHRRYLYFLGDTLPFFSIQLCSSVIENCRNSKQIMMKCSHIHSKQFDHVICCISICAVQMDYAIIMSIHQLLWFALQRKLFKS